METALNSGSINFNRKLMPLSEQRYLFIVE